MEKLLTTPEAAEYLTQNGFPVKPKSLEVWRSSGKGPIYIKISRRVFYRPSHLDRFLAGIEIRTIDPAVQSIRLCKARGRAAC